VLNGLGIPFVGERTGVLLAETFGSMDAIAQADEGRCSPRRRWARRCPKAIPRRFLHEHQHRELIERLRAAGLQFEYERKGPVGGPLQGKTFVITGTLPT